MTMDTCTVTGVLRDCEDNVMPSQTLTVHSIRYIYPEEAVFGAILREPITVQSDLQGDISFDILPGFYRIDWTFDNRLYTGMIRVPAEPSANIQDLFQSASIVPDNPVCLVEGYFYLMDGTPAESANLKIHTPMIVPSHDGLSLPVPITSQTNAVGLFQLPLVPNHYTLAWQTPVLVADTGLIVPDDTFVHLSDALQGKRSSWSPHHLFSQMQAGFYAPLQQSLRGIYQDAAGTTPVTSYDQPVGLIKRQAGTVDLVQTVSASRLTMARWPRGNSGVKEGRFVSSLNMSTISLEVKGNIIKTIDDVYMWAIKADLSGSQTVRPRIYEVDPSDGVSVIRTVYTGVEFLVPYREVFTLNCNGAFLEKDKTYAITIERIDGNAVKFTYSSDSQAVDFGSFIFKSESRAKYKDIPDGGAFDAPGPWSMQQDFIYTLGVEEQTLYHLYNDGGDSLQTYGPVPAGTYGYAYVDPYGEITFDTRESDGINPVTVADDPGRYLDLILRKGDFSADEKVRITDYWERRYK